MSLKMMFATAALLIGALVAPPAPAQAPIKDAVIKSTSIMVSCEVWGSGALCEIDAPGAASYSWSTSGYVTVPYLCPSNEPMCTFGCPRVGRGYVTGYAYDAGGVLIGSARRQVCYSP
ncbi:MAG TPA: hypothetical protein VLK29_00805 [Luteimonas sp.]|nr:hypothetical protein [Luteimonas sp.]